MKRIGWRMLLLGTIGLVLPLTTLRAQSDSWTKHVIYEGEHCNTAVAGDFTGDGAIDVICNAGGQTLLLVAPDWHQVPIGQETGLNLIHSEVMDVDRDGRLDFIGCRYKPGTIIWLRQPENASGDRWVASVVDEQVDGIHGLLVGDVDGDRHPDLLANSAQPAGPFANSLVWYRRTGRRGSIEWQRQLVADGDAPGLSHYLGLGDVNGDGRADVASAAKGGPQDSSAQGNWFAYWEAPRRRKDPWIRHLLAADQPGATNIHPADVNGDGLTDFIASRGHDRGVIWFEAPSWKLHTIHPDLFGPHCLQVVDMDGDGDMDAATCAKDDKRVAWFENDGRGNFTTHIIGTDQAAYDIRAVDMDRDGDLDLLIAGQASKNVVWFESPLK